MRLSLSVFILALLLNACASVSNLQHVTSKIPCLGAMGNEKTTLFKKEFQKVGEPNLKNSISVSLASVPFNKKSYANYKNHHPQLGKNPSIKYVDSSPVKPHFYKLKITDLVSLKTQLNNPENRAIREYLINDHKLRTLTTISFVTGSQEEQQLKKAEHLFIVERNGLLSLEIHTQKQKSTLKMSSLEQFDFETSGFCWKNNIQGKPEIAFIASSGDSCPGSTESNPEKLDETKAYLKF